MAVRLRSVAFACEDPSTAAAFWANLLGRQVVDDARGPLVPGDDTQLGLRFVPTQGPRTGLNRMHVHVTSTSLEDQRARVAAALDLGARHLDVGQQPEEGHVVMADPEGNAFCVIEPGNSFLAGCGVVGELACDGSRDVGVFWSAALDWSLVWDQDGETAVQSPQGGTKVAWGGASPLQIDGMQRQHFELVAVGADLAAEVHRLLALGATTARGAGGDVLLTDPGGVWFRLANG